MECNNMNRSLILLYNSITLFMKQNLFKVMIKANQLNE